ncbi:MAG: hypothetical protein ACO2ER_08965, partial [Castellaniella sp.]
MIAVMSALIEGLMTLSLSASANSTNANSPPCAIRVARLASSGRADTIEHTTPMAQGGELAFVLFSETPQLKIISPPTNTE